MCPLFAPGSSSLVGPLGHSGQCPSLWQVISRPVISKKQSRPHVLVLLSVLWSHVLMCLSVCPNVHFLISVPLNQLASSYYQRAVSMFGNMIDNAHTHSPPKSLNLNCSPPLSGPSPPPLWPEPVECAVTCHVWMFCIAFPLPSPTLSAHPFHSKISQFTNTSLMQRN